MATREGGRENGGKSNVVSRGINHEIALETKFSHRRVSLNAKAAQAVAGTVQGSVSDSSMVRRRSANAAFDLP